MANLSGLLLIGVFYAILAGLYQDASVDFFAILAIVGGIAFVTTT
ncbi:MAG TPA: hypothetical protein VI874_03790 [Candidatus Norongarragalinales archaeon]|nr:hypothetical protein [Candidatus Norongarragalinales archaeon]